MTESNNPQAAQMADESMVRNLAAQARAVWPQEQPLLERYALPPEPRVLDVACGTGEISARFVEHFDDAHLIGVDLLESHLELARERCRAFKPRARFEVGDAYNLRFDDNSFDLALCRHLLQAVPRPGAVVAELVRVTRPGGVVHLVAEDYGMMHFHPTPLDADEFWRRGPIAFAELTGTDLRSGRKMFTELTRLGLEGVRVDYVTIDSLRVEPATFSAIWKAWRDGYSAAIVERTSLTRSEVDTHFAGMIAAIEDPEGYAVWQLPVISGRLPAKTRP